MKKNLKKITAVGLTAILGAGLLAGCGGGDGKTSDGKTKLHLVSGMKIRDLQWRNL